MKTKSFDSFFGVKQVSREDFIKQWVETTKQYTSLFYSNGDGDKLLDFQFKLQELAGKAWDKHD